MRNLICLKYLNRNLNRNGILNGIFSGVFVGLYGFFNVNQAFAQTQAPNIIRTDKPPSPTIAQPSKKSDISLFQNLNLSPKFTPNPQVLRGISGGTEETQKQSGTAKTETGICIGFIDSVPDHQVTLSSAFDYLQLKISSTGDTILLIKGPGGIWCNDDQENPTKLNTQVSDRNPEISGAWLAGTYDIWIGSYEAKASFPYLLEISQQQPK
jgi:hypothetical protein